MSNAKKKRNHIIRNGGRNPELFRGEALEISTHVRKTPTLQQKRDRQMQKHSKLNSDY